MKSFNQLIADALTEINEVFRWDLEKMLLSDTKPLIVDIREDDEYQALHINDSIFVPRGILEQACEWNYDVTIPELVKARQSEVVLVCRSGTRSVLAALTMKIMGYTKVSSLKTGIRGWNDYDLPLIDSNNNDVDPDVADEFLANKVSKEQLQP